MECEKNPITTETLIIKKTIGSLFKLILKNLYKKICKEKYIKKKEIEFNITCIWNTLILNMIYVVKYNNCAF